MPVAPFRDTMNLLKILTPARVWNYCLLKLSYGISVLIRKPVHAGKPSFISVEPANICNLRCPECIAGTSGFTRQQGMMRNELFKRALAAMPGETFYLNLYFQGEPFLNTDFFEFALAAKKRKMYVAVSTNGHFLDSENCQATVDSGIDRLIISLDGADAETYSDYRRGGNFDTVVAGIKNLVEYRDSRNAHHPYIVLQFLVSGNNETQITQMKQLAKNLGTDKLELKTMQLLDAEHESYKLPANRRFRRYERDAAGHLKLRNSLPNRCFRMWSAPVICQDGTVVPCCYDKDAAHVMGNISDDSLLDIWNDGLYQAFRKTIFSRRKSVPMCRNCTEGSRFD